MTAKQVQIRRDTEANLNSATPALGELGVDTTNNRLVVGDGLTPGGVKHVNSVDFQTEKFRYASVAGTADAIELTCTPAIEGYTAGLTVLFIATSTNTTSVTVDINGEGAKSVYKVKSGVLSNLEAGDFISGGLYRITYDGTQFQVSGLDDAQPGSVGWDLLSIATGGGAAYQFTSNIDSNYSNYVFLLENVRPVNNAANLIMRVRRSGQGSFDASAGQYSWVLQRANYLSGTGTNITGAGANTAETAIRLATSVANIANGGFGVSGFVYSYKLAQSDLAKFMSDIVNTHNASPLQQDRFCGGGTRLSTTALDGVEFRYSSGNIESGSIYMYGIRSSLA